MNNEITKFDTSIIIKRNLKLQRQHYKVANEFVI